MGVRRGWPFHLLALREEAAERNVSTYLNFWILMQGVLSLKFAEFEIIDDLHVPY